MIMAIYMMMSIYVICYQIHEIFTEYLSISCLSFSTLNGSNIGMSDGENLVAWKREYANSVFQNRIF